MTELVPLAYADPQAVEALLDAAFGADRRTRTAYRLRNGMPWLAELSFAAFDGETLVGSVQCWPVALGQVGLTLVGPVAVDPLRQRGGLGRMLMERCLAAADTGGHDALVLIGDAEYYGRFFGFTAAPTQGWDLPGPVDRARLLARVAPGLMMPKRGVLGPDPRFASAAATA